MWLAFVTAVRLSETKPDKAANLSRAAAGGSASRHNHHMPPLDPSWAPYLPAVITGVFALLAGFVGQVAGSTLTARTANRRLAWERERADNDRLLAERHIIFTQTANAAFKLVISVPHVRTDLASRVSVKENDDILLNSMGIVRLYDAPVSQDVKDLRIAVHNAMERIHMGPLTDDQWEDELEPIYKAQSQLMLHTREAIGIRQPEDANIRPD